MVAWLIFVGVVVVLSCLLVWERDRRRRVQLRLERLERGLEGIEDRVWLAGREPDHDLPDATPVNGAQAARR